MRGAFSKRAAMPQGGLIREPPISWRLAIRILGQKIPRATWQEIRRAFQDYEMGLRALKTSKLSLSKGDEQSWHLRKNAATKAVEAAMERLDSARSRHGDFLEEASEFFAVRTFGRSFGPDESARRFLDEAYALMLRAVTVIDRAEPEEIQTPTAAHARDLLVRNIRDALRASGLETRLSNGFDHGQLEKVKLEDLTAFERLIVEFLIGDDKKPAALSAWLRGALSDGGKLG